MSEFTIPLNRDSEEPIYRQLIRQIKMQIESGSLTPGTRLPASRDLAKSLDISRISVVNAYAELRAEGYLSAHAGRGTFVSRDVHPAGGQQHTGSAETQEEFAMPDSSLRDMMRLARRPGVINFSHGSPPMEFFPMSALRSALNTVLDRDGASALTYELAEGYTPLRNTVRDYVSALGIRCSADEVLITGGAQQAIDLVMQALVGEGQTIVTTNPTYLGVIDIARTRRLHIEGIPMDDDGIRLDHLENFLVDHAARLIYVQPSFQNPTGNIMPMHRRRQLLNLAHEYGVTVVEDGTYHEFRFEGESLLPLKAIDEHHNVIHISGFTKMLLPGMRIGYIISGNHYLERLVRVKLAADISTSGLNQRAIHLMIQRGVLAQALERNNRELQRRRDAALAAAKQYFPAGTTWTVPQGGLYLWARLPRHGPGAAELYVAALQRQVSFAIGSVFFTDGCGSHRMRLNYGLQRPELIEEGFRRIGETWHSLMDTEGDYDHAEKAQVL
ncbi:MAG: PLP-dependent aminotransferase family protein [Anaerolineae bacterium]|nr:PLP-dependent aminotransferase family protein [Anaerolineae bacterium]